MHVCSRIVKVIFTKSIVIISSKDRDTPASIRFGAVVVDGRGDDHGAAAA